MRKSEKEWRTCCCNITADLSDFTSAMEERHQNRIFVGLHERHKPVRGHRTRRPGYISPAGHHTQFSHATERRGREKRSKREKEKRDTSVSDREEEKEKKRSKRKGRGEERR